jgi:hypothetical protein
MADGSDNKLALNMDKIAYSVAGLFGLCVLAVAFMSGGELVELRKEIANAKQDITSMQGRNLPEREIPNIERALRKQWSDTVKVKSATPEWGHERIPGYVLLQEGPGTSYAEHPNPVIKELHCLRSPKSFRAYVKVIAELPARSSADLVDIKLLRKDEEGEFAELKRFATKLDLEKVAETGALEYRDPQVKAGKSYTYKVISLAERAAAAEEHIQLQDEDKEKHSNECTTSGPIPFDYWLKIVTARPFDEDSGELGHFIGSILLASSEPGAEPTTINPPNGRRFEEGFSFGPKVVRGKPLFEIRQIVKDNEVGVRNRKTTKTKTLKPGQKSPSLILPEHTECPAAGSGSAGDGDEGDEEDPDGDEDTDKGATAKDDEKDSDDEPKPKPKKKGGFR